MTQNIPETGNTEKPGTSRRGNAFQFGLLIAVAIIIPPIGLALGLLVLTAGTEESFAKHGRKRGGLLIAIAAAALMVQGVLGAVFIMPRVIQQFKEQLLADDITNPFRGINPSGFRNPEYRSDSQTDTLLEVLSPRIDSARSEKLYEDALVEISNGSKEPFPRYVVAAYYAYAENGDKIIEDTDTRYDEIERLIVEGRALKGEDKRSKAMLDMTMIPLYMQTRLHDEDVDEARAIYSELDRIKQTDIPADYIKFIKRWGYNTFYEYYEVRDPGKALDEAFNTIPGLSFDGSILLLGNFYYEIYGGFDNVFQLSLRLGREEDFFAMLDTFVETARTNGSADDVFAAMYYFRGRYLGDAGRWDEALDAYRKANELTPGNSENEYADNKAWFETGHHTEAAGLVWGGVISAGDEFRELELRSLYRDYPAEGLEFLRSKLPGDGNRESVLSCMAILAKDAGDDALARAIAGYFALAESGDAAEESNRIIDALMSGDDTLAESIVRAAAPGFVTKGDGLFAQAYVLAPDAAPADAALLTRMVIEAEPYEYEPCFSLYNTYYDSMSLLGRTGEALDFLKTNAEAFPDELYPSYFYALKLQENGRDRDALEIYEELRLRWNYPAGQGMATMYFEFPGSAHYWFTRLNDVEIYDVFVQTALIYKDLGERGSYEHYLYLAGSRDMSRCCRKHIF